MPRRKQPLPTAAPEDSRPCLTWAAALERFEEHLRAERKSRLTVMCYLGVLRALGRHLGGDRAPRPGQVSLQELRSYLCHLLTGDGEDRALTAGTVARIATTISSFFNFLQADGLWSYPDSVDTRIGSCRPESAW